MSKRARKIVKTIDRLTDYGMLLFFIPFILIGLYSAYDAYMLYAETTDDSILRHKPGYESDAPDDGKEIQGRMVAWITLDDTKVDYPVMQGKDNSEYVNKNPYGEFSFSGSVFLDARNSADFTDRYNLLYGHHMEHDLMFGVLDRYLKEDFFKSHKDGTLIVGNEDFKFRLFCVLETDATNREIFDPTRAGSNEDFIEYARKNSAFYDEKSEARDDERLIALTTCKFPNTSERTVVIGAIEPAKERKGEER